MDYKIVIDAGHGGNDPGASGNGIIEKDLTLAISKYMYEKFKQLGVPVTLIRDKDETINPDERVKKILDAYGNLKNVIVISNHINAGGGDGAEVIYALRNTNKLSDIILNNLEQAGQNVRKAYQKRLPSDTSKDYYFIHRNTGITEPVIVEYGFLDSKNDDINQLKNDYKKYTEAVVKAVSEYIGINPNSDYYIVIKGDSLYKIANKFNTTIDEIKKLNNLTSNNLSIGQKLLIPKKVNNTYTVVKGDNLYSIAKKFNTTQNEIMKLNNLNSNLLSIGQILLIPQNKIDDDTYIVISGDSLYKIANKFNTTVDEIKKLNNLTSNNLSIGQKLLIPKDNNIYIVNKGDSLWSIAKKFNTTVDSIKQKNNLNNNLLSIGQTLKI